MSVDYAKSSSEKGLGEGIIITKYIKQALETRLLQPDKKLLPAPAKDARIGRQSGSSCRFAVKS